MTTKAKSPTNYVPPSRAGKRSILIHVEPEVVDAFNAAKTLLGLTQDGVGLVALRMLFEDLGQDVPASIATRLNAPATKPGPVPGRSRNPRNAPGD